MKNKNLTLAQVIISFLAALCFFVTFIIHKKPIYLILGCVWIIISIEGTLRFKNQNKN